MPIISIFSGAFCNEDKVVKAVLKKNEYRLIKDDEIVSSASKISKIQENKIKKAFSAKKSVFNKFTHEKERSIAYLKLALADILLKDNILITGFSIQLIPKEINHVLRCCLIADMKYRVSQALESKNISEQEAIKLIRQEDESRSIWLGSIGKAVDPWDSSLYDIVLPTDKMRTDEIASTINDYAAKEVLQVTEKSKSNIENFYLESKVETVIAEEGHDVEVKAVNGDITLTVNKHVLMLNRLEEELKAATSKIEGVRSVETKVGENFYQADIYRKFNFETPSKILLVDDEREFVQTLSERLLMRDMGSTVAYDGEEALNMVKEDDPEVMILDLKMPGIDGIEVLRRVKASSPDIEVIILTGHGSEADKKICMELGAFAYLQKPVDIEVLSDTLKKANEKIYNKKNKL